jgi:nitrogen fixation/metabolism regulation signal transduction histidine kinase
MSDTNLKALLLSTILITTVLPLLAACYFLDRAVKTSLNLGFNAQIPQVLEMDSQHLKSLKKLDPEHENAYRTQFEDVENLRRIYSEPEWLKRNILGSLRIYAFLGLAAAASLSVLVAVLLSRRITRSYRLTFEELTAHRERVQYLQQMSSWQELARILAHEIKNPLTPIEVLVTSLSRSYLAKPSEEFAEQLQQTEVMIAEELAHLKLTVRRFSDFAKLPAAELMEMNPAQVVERHLPALAATFGTADIQFEVLQCPAEVRAKLDPSLFRQVLMNIIGNGVEANPARNVVFSIALTTTGSSIVVSISNDGAVIAPEIAVHMFEPHITSAASKENMGLGLAIVKRIVMEHGGEISYVEQSGSPRFIISLPRTK